MKPSDKNAFAELLLNIAELYQYKISGEVLQLFWQALEDLDLGAIKQALSEHLRDETRGKWMPKPADIRHFYMHPGCKTCNAIGVVVLDEGRVLPWSLEREVNQGLLPEVCPDCKGRNRVDTPGLPNVRFG